MLVLAWFHARCVLREPGEIELSVLTGDVRPAMRLAVVVKEGPHHSSLPGRDGRMRRYSKCHGWYGGWHGQSAKVEWDWEQARCRYFHLAQSTAERMRGSHTSHLINPAKIPRTTKGQRLRLLFYGQDRQRRQGCVARSLRTRSPGRWTPKTDRPVRRRHRKDDVTCFHWSFLGPLFLFFSFLPRTLSLRISTTPVRWQGY